MLHGGGAHLRTILANVASELNARNKENLFHLNSDVISSDILLGCCTVLVPAKV